YDLRRILWGGGVSCEYHTGWKVHLSACTGRHRRGYAERHSRADRRQILPGGVKRGAAGDLRGDRPARENDRCGRGVPAVRRAVLPAAADGSQPVGPGMGGARHLPARTASTVKGHYSLLKKKEASASFFVCRTRSVLSQQLQVVERQLIGGIQEQHLFILQDGQIRTVVLHKIVGHKLVRLDQVFLVFFRIRIPVLEIFLVKRLGQKSG